MFATFTEPLVTALRGNPMVCPPTPPILMEIGTVDMCMLGLLECFV